MQLHSKAYLTDDGPKPEDGCMTLCIYESAVNMELLPAGRLISYRRVQGSYMHVDSVYVCHVKDHE